MWIINTINPLHHLLFSHKQQPTITKKKTFFFKTKSNPHDNNKRLCVHMLMCKKTHCKFVTHRKETKLHCKHTNITRRKATSLFVLVSFPTPIYAQPAYATESSILDMFRMTVPDQTVEEAENGIGEHAMSLVQVKELLELESWKEAQKELRKSAAYLKQDIYTIIQGKPGMERAQLRNLYSKLFNGVIELDYAARDKDVPRVWKLYEDIVVTLDDILSKV